LGIFVPEKRVPFVTSSIRGSRGRLGRLTDREKYGTGDKNNKDEESVNGTQIPHWKVSNRKTGLSFQEFRLFRKISSGTNAGRIRIPFTSQPELPEVFGK